MWSSNWCLLLLAGLYSTTAAQSQVAKVYPGDDKYPNLSEWAQLNSTIGGKLIAAALPAAACYPGNYNAEKCSTAVRRAYYGSEEDPLLVKVPWWSGLTCQAQINATGTCTLGNYPTYVVNASSTVIVSQALKFANKWNLRVVIKNTGHDFLGRNVGYGSLSIWTHHFKGMRFEENWVPTAGPAAPPRSAVVFGSGYMVKELYAAAHKNNKFVTAGTYGSVGAGGGWLQGGGHGFFTNRHGLGVDNVLEFEVVLPDGQVAIVNTGSYPDLFFALRGGGGGTWGVVTKVTFKTHEIESTNAMRITVTSNNQTLSKWANGMAYLMSTMPSWADFGLSSYPVMNKRYFDGIFMAPRKSMEEIENFITPIAGQLRGMGFNVTLRKTPSETYRWQVGNNAVPNPGAPPQFFGDSGHIIQGTRLIGREGLADQNMIEKVLAYLFERDYHLEPYCLGGGAVEASKEDTGLNPAWRKSILHFSILPPNQGEAKTVPAVQKVYRRVQDDVEASLEKLSVGSAAYFNEASYLEPEWQKTFWGSNYPRLLEVKRKYDPNNTLWCSPCVGSDVFIVKEDRKLYYNK